jgi:hypothetical protein
MPNLVKCLRDVKEGCRAVLSVVDGVVESVDETMSLFNCGVLRSEKCHCLNKLLSVKKE